MEISVSSLDKDHAKTEGVTLPQEITNHLSDERVQEMIRLRAYELYQERGAEDGLALADWLQAEAEIMAASEVLAAA